MAAIAPHPVKSSKRDPGLRDVPVTFAGVTVRPGAWIYADMDAGGRWTGKVHTVRGEATGEDGTRDDPRYLILTPEESVRKSPPDRGSSSSLVPPDALEGDLSPPRAYG